MSDWYSRRIAELERELTKDQRIAELERELAEARKALRRLQLWCEAVEADAEREGEK